jgi:hypothetical protein
MISYWKDTQQRKTFKLDTSSNDKVAFVYWVQVHMESNGAFIHARGRDVISIKDKAEEILKETATATTEKEYIEALKDYFAIDKKVREQFISQYKL